MVKESVQRRLAASWLPMWSVNLPPYRNNTAACPVLPLTTEAEFENLGLVCPNAIRSWHWTSGNPDKEYFAKGIVTGPLYLAAFSVAVRRILDIGRTGPAFTYSDLCEATHIRPLGNAHIQAETFEVWERRNGRKSFESGGDAIPFCDTGRRFSGRASRDRPIG